jgi:hypothetical protein
MGRDNDDGTIGGHQAQKPWRLDGVGAASRIVKYNTDAGAYLEAIEVVEKIADVP